MNICAAHGAHFGFDQNGAWFKVARDRYVFDLNRSCEGPNNSCFAERWERHFDQGQAFESGVNDVTLIPS